MPQKVGSVGRFGPRYGTRTRKIIRSIESKKNNVCPYCERPAAKRIAAGVWYCKKCKTKFAGGAYFPKT